MAALDFFAVSDALLECAYVGLDRDGDLAIGRKCHVLGEIAWDGCDCGQLVISEDRRYPSRVFPVEEVDHTAECGAPWIVAVFTLELQRCVPGPDDNGNPPDCAALRLAAQQLSKDMTDMRYAVQCCLNDLFDKHDQGVEAWELGAQEVTGPQGGCIATSLQIMVGRTNDCGC